MVFRPDCRPVLLWDLGRDNKVPCGTQGYIWALGTDRKLTWHSWDTQKALSHHHWISCWIFAFVLLFWGRMPPCFLVCLTKKDDYHHQLPSLCPLLSCRKLKALLQKSPVHSPAARELNPPGWAWLPEQHYSIDSLVLGHSLASWAAKLGISIAAAEITRAALKKKCWHLGPLPDPLNRNL